MEDRDRTEHENASEISDTVRPTEPIPSQQIKDSSTADAPKEHRVHMAGISKPWDKKLGRSIKAWFIRLWRKAPDRQVELFMAFAIVCFSAAQWHTAKANNDSTSQQTQQLITAAGISAQAATDNVIASRNFADSARGINQGVAAAVSKLEAQANAIEASRETSEASSTEALKATIENFHAEQRAWVAVQNVTVVPPEDPDGHIGAEMQIRNSGRTPALNVRVAVSIAPLATSTFNPLYSSPIDFPEDYKEAEADPRETNRPDSQPILAPDGHYNAIIRVPKYELQPLPPALHYVYTWYLHGRIRYTDIFGKDHWIVMCDFLQSTGKRPIWSPCSSHNEIDKQKNN